MVVVDTDMSQQSSFYMNMAGDNVHDSMVRIPCVMISSVDGDVLIEAATSGLNEVKLVLGETPLVLVDVSLDQLTAEEHADLLEHVSVALAELNSAKQARSHGELLAKVDLFGDDVEPRATSRESEAVP